MSEQPLPLIGKTRSPTLEERALLLDLCTFPLSGKVAHAKAFAIFRNQIQQCGVTGVDSAGQLEINIHKDSPRMLLPFPQSIIGDAYYEDDDGVWVNYILHWDRTLGIITFLEVYKTDPDRQIINFYPDRSKTRWDFMDVSEVGT